MKRRGLTIYEKRGLQHQRRKKSLGEIPLRNKRKGPETENSPREVVLGKGGNTKSLERREGKTKSPRKSNSHKNSMIQREGRVDEGGEKVTLKKRRGGPKEGDYVNVGRPSRGGDQQERGG